MIVPAVILFTTFFVVPFAQGIYMAFTNWDGFARMDFIGLDNFTRFFSDSRASNAVINTMIYGLCGTVAVNVLGIMLAVFLDSGLRTAGLLRTLFYLPTIISPLIMGYIWKFILSSENGVLLDTLQKLNMPMLYSDWLANPAQARIVIVFVYAWQNVGGNLIIYLAGLQSIDSEILESAQMDGANRPQLLAYIKLPLITASFRINIITSIIGSMSIFDVVVSLTNGGPGYYTESLSQFVYKQSTTGQAGYSSAVAMMMLMIILIPVVLAFTAMKRMYMEN